MTFKILDVQWHIGHQYELLKMPFIEWSWLMHYKRPAYSHAIRGNISALFKEVPFYEPGKYDAAILHLDQECLLPYTWKHGKGTLYREMNMTIQDIPKIVIMHGTPYHPEAPLPYSTHHWLTTTLREVIGNNYLIVNSHQAAQQWGMGVPLIHGLDSGEWFDLPKQPRVVTTLSPGGMDSYYDRRFLAEVKAVLKKHDILHCQIGTDFVPRNWTQYRTFIGTSLIYFNPTKESPMPRSRTEAMLSGCCIITTPYHDADTFIQSGINGFLVERDANIVAVLIEDLINNPQHAVMIGTNGKRTAQELFSWHRFADDWLNTLHLVTNHHRSTSTD